MVKNKIRNKENKTLCPSTSKFDTIIHWDFLPSFPTKRITELRGMLSGEYSDEFMDIFKKDLQNYIEENNIANREALTEKYSVIEAIIKEFDSINGKLTKKQELSEDNKLFMQIYSNSLSEFVTFCHKEGIKIYAQNTAGVQSRAVAKMYDLYKQKIPAAYRNEVRCQLISLVTYILDEVEKVPKYRYYTREELIQRIAVKGFSSSGFESLMYICRKQLAKQHAALKANGTLSEEQDKMLSLLMNDSDAWQACVYEAKNMLYEAEKIKVGKLVPYVESAEDREATDEEATSGILDGESHNEREHWQVRADTVSSFNSMTREVRSILYRLVASDKLGILGLPETINVMKIHQHLLDIRRDNFCQNSSEFLTVLENLSAPWGPQLARMLKQDSYKRSAFFNVYKKNKLHYVHHRRKWFKSKELGKPGGMAFYRNTDNVNPQVVLGIYKANAVFVDSINVDCIFTADGGINDDNLAKVRNTFYGVATDSPFYDSTNKVYDMNVWYNNIRGGNILEGVADEDKKAVLRRNFVQKVNNVLNLHMGISDIDSVISNEKSFSNFCSSVHTIMEELNKSANYSGISTLLGNSTIKKAFQKLTVEAMRSVVSYTEKSPVERVHRYNKSTYMIDTIPNHLGDTLERLGKYVKRGREELRKYLEDTYLNCPIYATKKQVPKGDGTYEIQYDIHNYYLDKFYNATDEDLKNPSSFINRFIEGTTRGLGTLDKEFSLFSEKDNYIFFMNEFLQMYRDTNGAFGVTPLFVTGDSSSTRFLTTPILTKEEIIEKMVDVACSELQRMQAFKDVRKYLKDNSFDIPAFLSNEDKFTLLPFLNEDDNIKKEDLISRGRNNLEAFREIVRPLIEKHLNNGYKKQISDLKDKKIVINDSSLGDVIDYSVLAVPDTAGYKLLPIHGGKTTGSIYNDILEKIYYNTKFNLIQQLQFFTVDPGFYKGTDDLQKRYKEMIAAGDTLDLEAVEPINPLRKDDAGYVYTGDKKVDNNNGKQTVVYVNDVFTDLDNPDGNKKDKLFMRALRQLGLFKDIVGTEESPKKSKFNANNLTDGQAYRSFSSYRKLMIMRGAPYWTEAHEAIYQIIMASRAAGRTRLSKKDLKKIINLGVVFQPLKPFYFGFEYLGEGEAKIPIPVQHKYSELPLIPELFPEGSKLEQLGWAMEDNDNPIDLICYDSCVKVGGFGSTSFTGCTDTKSFKEALSKGHRHILSLEGWRQQSNVPNHVDSERAVGSQLLKHLYACIQGSNNKVYPFISRIFGNKIKLTSTKTIDISQGLSELNLIQLIGALDGSFRIKSILELVKSINDPQVVSEMLSEMKANDSRAAKDSIGAYILDEYGEFKISPAEGMEAKDNMAALLSKLRNLVIKHSMKGGSAVQASAYGMDDVLKVNIRETDTPDGNKLNIIDADCAIPFAFSFKYEDGTTVDLSGDYLDYVDYDTGMLLDEEGKPVEPEYPTGEKGQEYYGWNTKLGKAFPGILDLIAYRIPTEKDYSVINLKAKRFFPKTSGGIIMVPSQFTTIAGFDFDIDKLYFIRREYVYSKKPNIDNQTIWEDFYKSSTGKQIFPYLEEAYKNAKAKKEGTLDLGDHYYEFWRPALDLMAADGKDISDMPKTAEDAFTMWVQNNMDKYVENKSNFDPEKTFIENSKTALNNLLFEFLQARLEDYDTFQERYTIGGYKMLTDAKSLMNALKFGNAEELKKVFNPENPTQPVSIQELRELAITYENYSEPLDPSDLSTVVYYQTRNAVADRCISISAIQNINQRLTALMEKLSIKNIEEGNVYIRFGSMLNSTDERVGRDIKARELNGIDTELLVTNFLAAAVDAVKDDVLTPLGIDDRNLSVVCLLAKVGASAEDIGLLFNQPVVALAMKIIREQGRYMEMSTALDLALQEIAGSKYTDRKKNAYFKFISKEADIKAKRNAYLTTESLIKNIILNRSSNYGGGANVTDFLDSQFAVVALLNEAAGCASELSEEISITQSTSIKSVKSTLGAIQAVLQRALAFSRFFGSDQSKFDVQVNKPSVDDNTSFGIIDPGERITEENKEELLGKYVDSPLCGEQIAFSTIMTFMDALSEYFPYNSNGFTFLANLIGGLTKKGYMSAEMFDAHNLGAMQFFLERIVPEFNGDNTVGDLQVGQVGGDNKVKANIPSSIFYTAVFPEYLKNILEINEVHFTAGNTKIRYKDIPILASIDIINENIYGSATDKFHILKMEGIGRLLKEDKDNLIESWEAMFLSKDPVLVDLAKHLFMYSYYNRGFGFGTTTLMSLVPLLVKTEIAGKKYRNFYNKVFDIKYNKKTQLLEFNVGSCKSMSPKEYAKAFILINRDTFPQLTKTIYKRQSSSNQKTPYDIITAKLEVPLNKSTASFTVTVDIENIENPDNPLISEIASFIKDKNGKITSAKFAPCLIIDNKVYICDNNIEADNNNDFNTVILNNGVGSITYYEMNLPFNASYSRPTRVGEKAFELNSIFRIGVGKLLESARNNYQPYEEDKPIESALDISPVDTDNVLGGSGDDSLSKEVSLSVGQVLHYIEEIRANVNEIEEGNRMWGIIPDENFKTAADNIKNLLKFVANSISSLGDISKLEELYEHLTSLEPSIIAALSWYSSVKSSTIDVSLRGENRDNLWEAYTNLKQLFLLKTNGTDDNLLADSSEKSPAAKEQNLCTRGKGMPY